MNVITPNDGKMPKIDFAKHTCFFVSGYTDKSLPLGVVILEKCLKVVFGRPKSRNSR